MLKGRTVVVTGASSGIGEEIAGQAKAAGATVIAVDINPPKIETDRYIKADLSDRASIDALVAQLPSGIHGLANIAGLAPTQPEVAVLKVNLVGLKHLTLSLIPKLSDGASVVNLASLAGVGWPDAIPAIRDTEHLEFEDVEAYCSTHKIEGARSYFLSKEAITVWTMQNRWTWRNRGIRMNAVSPGPVDTPILQDFVETLGARAEEDMRTMDRVGTPKDIAPIVIFLLSDGSGWIRGANIPADGGMFSQIQSQIHGF